MGLNLSITQNKEYHLQSVGIPFIAQTPPMGWITWGEYYINANEDSVKAMIDAMVSSGMVNVGYEYVMIDGGWNSDGPMGSAVPMPRDANGKLQASSTKFPHGIKYLSDYAHEREVKLGLYASPGEYDCVQGLGCLGHEETDANTFAEWEIDCLKYDNCTFQGTKEEFQEAYRKMSQYLVATGRDILFYVCDLNIPQEPWKWAGKIGHLWRTGTDSNDTWNDVSWGGTNVMDNYEVGLSILSYYSINGWNDFDYISVMSSSKTIYEKESQMAIWCLLNAPLIQTGWADQSNTPDYKRIIQNKHLIAIDKDCTSKVVRVQNSGSKSSGMDVLVKELRDGLCIALLNKSGSTYTYDGTLLEYLGKYDVLGLSIYDVLSDLDNIGSIGDTLSIEMASHQIKVYKIKYV